MDSPSHWSPCHSRVYPESLLLWCLSTNTSARWKVCVQLLRVSKDLGPNGLTLESWQCVYLGCTQAPPARWLYHWDGDNPHVEGIHRERELAPVQGCTPKPPRFPPAQILPGAVTVVGRFPHHVRAEHSCVLALGCWCSHCPSPTPTVFAQREAGVSPGSFCLG